jgi:UDP-3-O-[3-hydroxymyristoyl] N-acetylglucosamine deacetylase/3-hydroxyacyl-[acyl-carrier-protein] dehydratase
MDKNQRTIQNPTEFSGIGLHTGRPCTIKFQPAPTGQGVRFRIKIDGRTHEIVPDIDKVNDVNRGTTISEGQIQIHTVEHVLAALAGLEIDNVICEMDNYEPPVGDGSAKPFVEVLLAAGIEKQNELKNYIEIDEPVVYSEPERKVDIIVLPSEAFRVTFMVDYHNPALGTQYTSLVSLADEFAVEFAPARTFCFLHEVEFLYKEGLIKGGRLDNAVVITDHGMTQEDVDRLKVMLNYPGDVPLGKTGILNDTPVRFHNEPVRHKVVDLIGDLALLGRPLKAHVLAARSGHKANIEIAKKIRAQVKKKEISRKYSIPETVGGLVLDAQAIEKIMPHRYPMLLIDRVLDLVPGKTVVAIKNVTINEPFFAGHFPGHPIMPGVLVVEAMAQAGGILLLNAVENPESKVVYFLGIDGVRFRKPVTPGDQLRFELEMISFRRSTCKMAGKAFVGDKLVTEATLLAAVVEK